MKKLEVFDPAMCCSTGVCGVDVDPVLAQFAADLKWVEEQGVAVARHNLGQEPQAFAANPAVVKEMEAGMDRLPILAVDGHVVSTGIYLTRPQLAQKLGLALATADTDIRRRLCRIGRDQSKFCDYSGNRRVVSSSTQVFSSLVEGVLQSGQIK